MMFLLVGFRVTEMKTSAPKIRGADVVFWSVTGFKLFSSLEANANGGAGFESFEFSTQVLIAGCIAF
jgi:hypothetical protein